MVTLSPVPNSRLYMYTWEDIRNVRLEPKSTANQVTKGPFNFNFTWQASAILLIFVDLSSFQHVTLPIDLDIQVFQRILQLKKKNNLPKQFSPVVELPSFWIIFRMWANSTSVYGGGTGRKIHGLEKDRKSMDRSLSNTWR